MSSAFRAGGTMRRAFIAPSPERRGKIHGRAGEVHFHELGALDAVADVTAFCMLIQALSPDKICASAIHVGSGQVRCAHGLMPSSGTRDRGAVNRHADYGGTV